MPGGSFFVAISFLLITILLLRATMAYPPQSRLFPLIALFALIFLLVIQIIKELSAAKEKRRVDATKPDVIWSRYLSVWIWIAGCGMFLWLFGFMGTVVFLPFFYLKCQKESWLRSIIVSLACGVFFYTIFDLLLRMPLYRGVLFSKLLS